MALKNREIHHYLIVNHSLSCIDGMSLICFESDFDDAGLSCHGRKME
jgi:hypothetical protein